MASCAVFSDHPPTPILTMPITSTSPSRPSLRMPSIGYAAAFLVVLALGACAAKPPTTAVSATEFEGVPMAVNVEDKPDATFVVTVRETSTRAGTDPIDDIRLYQRVANKVVADRCGPVQTAELVSESSKQGLAGRDFVFKCGLARIDRSQPQTLMQQR